MQAIEIKGHVHISAAEIAPVDKHINLPYGRVQKLSRTLQNESVPICHRIREVIISLCRKFRGTCRIQYFSAYYLLFFGHKPNGLGNNSLIEIVVLALNFVHHLQIVSADVLAEHLRGSVSCNLHNVINVQTGKIHQRGSGLLLADVEVSHFLDLHDIFLDVVVVGDALRSPESHHKNVAHVPPAFRTFTQVHCENLVEFFL